MKISEFQSIRKKVTVDLGGDEPLIVEYYPAKLTRPLQRRLEAQQVAVKAKIDAGEELSQDEAAAGAALLIELAAGWNLTEDDGSPIPITAEVLLDRVGYLAVNAITEAIGEALSPNGPGGGKS